MKMRMTVLAVLMAVTPQMRATIHRALRPDDFEVVWAANAAEAVDVSSARRPDLVLMDLKQPAQSAWGEIESLRTANPSAPMIVLAERGGAYLRSIAGTKIAVVEKPFGATALAEAVSTLLNISVTPSFVKGGNAGRVAVEAMRFRASLLARHDAPLALAPSYRHWGINE